MAITDGNSNELVMPVQPLGGGYGNGGFLGGMPDKGYSYSGAVGTIQYSSDTEFSQKISGKSVDDVIPIIDDIMTALQRINPRLYNLAMSKL